MIEKNSKKISVALNAGQWELYTNAMKCGTPAQLHCRTIDSQGRQIGKCAWGTKGRRYRHW